MIVSDLISTLRCGFSMFFGYLAEGHSEAVVDL